MEELSGARDTWDLEKHPNGCLAGYQTDPTFGAAVYFALEVLEGISRDVEIRAKDGKIEASQLDREWTIAPTTRLPVPWIWLRALATAWSRYKSDGGPLGHAFGLEGGQGKSPTIERLAQMLDQRAIARWIWTRVQNAKTRGKTLRIEDAIQEAAEKFAKSDVTIRRAWRRFSSLERSRQPG